MYTKKQQYEVGDVIYASNYNMKYDYKQPISESNNPIVMNFFLIIYAEQQDSLTMHKRNYCALKMTTSIVDEAIYTCRYSNEHNAFMQKSGYVSCSKVHTFDYNQIAGYLGQMDQGTMKKIFKIYHRFQCELERQFIERI